MDMNEIMISVEPLDEATMAKARERQAQFEKHLYCGSTDLPLSDAGRAELQSIRYDIKNARFMTSGMKRTNETLQILFWDVSYEVDPACSILRLPLIAVLAFIWKKMLHDGGDDSAVGDDAGILPDFGECLQHTICHLLAVCG